jgi:hypothetical protein
MELSDATEKTLATPGIDRGTLRLVTQCLNHYATPGPNKHVPYTLIVPILIKAELGSKIHREMETAI